MYTCALQVPGFQSNQYDQKDIKDKDNHLNINFQSDCIYLNLFSLH